jgi:hypothetical protein
MTLSADITRGKEGRVDRGCRCIVDLDVDVDLDLYYFFAGQTTQRYSTVPASIHLSTTSVIKPAQQTHSIASYMATTMKGTKRAFT